MKKKLVLALLTAAALTAAVTSPRPAAAYDQCERLTGWAKGLCIAQAIVDAALDDLTRNW